MKKYKTSFLTMILTVLSTCFLLEAEDNNLTNGDFSNGSSPWYIHTTDQTKAELKINSSVALFDIETGSVNAWDMLLCHGDLKLEKDHTYTVSADIRTNGALKSIGFYVRRIGSQVKDYSGVFKEINSTKAKITFTFKMMDETDPQAQLYFALGANDVDVHLDNVSVIDSKAGVVKSEKIQIVKNNLVINGQFDKDKKPWYTHTKDGTHSELKIDSKIAKFNIEKSFANAWDMLLCQGDLKIENGKTYSVSADIWTDGQSKSVGFKLRRIGSSIKDYGGIFKEINGTQNMFNFTFKMDDQTDEKAQLYFALGANDVNVNIDNVSVVQVN